MWDAIIITPFVNALMFIYNIFGQNFGIAIILFTILIRFITLPLTAKQIKAAAAMQTLQSDKRYIDMQAKYKNDKEKLAQEQMALYKEMGVSPFASCLPTLIQFPIIIGLYQSLIQALASTPMDLLRLTSRIYPGFLNVGDIIPLNSHFLWMDLGAPERLTLPFLSFGIPVLAILVVISTFVQQKLMTPPTAGGPGDQSSQMMGMMNVYMPLLMGWLALTLSSGLALYFCVSNIIGILQSVMMGRANWDSLIFWRKPAPTTVIKKPSQGRK